MLDSLLIANRGEIACRIIRTARALGVRTIAVYSEADRGALHARTADEAILIGPAAAAESYLRAENILRAAAQTKARALHRRGTSTKLTKQKLRMAGIDGETLDKAMAALDQELDTDPRQREWKAAVALARRRRIGLWGTHRLFLPLCAGKGSFQLRKRYGAGHGNGSAG